MRRHSASNHHPENGVHCSRNLQNWKHEIQRCPRRPERARVGGRLAVFRLLVKRGPKGFIPSDLSERLEIPAPTLSFHLEELARADLVVSRRQGRNVYYSPNFERVNALI